MNWVVSVAAFALIVLTFSVGRLPPVHREVTLIVLLIAGGSFIVHAIGRTTSRSSHGLRMHWGLAALCAAVLIVTSVATVQHLMSLRNDPDETTVLILRGVRFVIVWAYLTVIVTKVWLAESRAYNWRHQRLQPQRRNS